MLNDDDFLFDMPDGEDSQYSQGSSNSFVKTTVSRNTETGEIQGWPEFYALLGLDHNDHLKSSGREQIAKYQNATKHTYVVLKPDGRDSMVSQDMSQLVTDIAHNIKAINIKNVQTDEIIEVKAIKDSQGKVSYENLPDEVEINIYHYTHEERWINFSDVIMCLLTMHATLGGAQGLGQGSTTDGETAYMLPSE